MNSVDIAMFIPSLRGGGAERVMVSLANGFASRGISVDMVLAKADGPFLQDVAPDVNVVDLRSPRVLRSLPRLVGYLRQRRPFALLSALSHANVIAAVAVAVARVETKLLVSEHNDLWLSTQALGVTRQAMYFALRHSYRKADAVIAVSKGVAEELAKALRLPREDVLLVYNPIVSPELAQVACDENLLLSAEKIILAAGRLTAQKDYPTLLRAFAQIHQRTDANLVILGEGDLRQELEELARKLGIVKRVMMPGFVRDPYSWMRRAELFVLSSAWEGFGNVLVEAMACGAPIVSTNCPSGPAEILENGRWGKLVPVGDVDSLASAIFETLSSDTRPNVRQRAADFGVDKAVDAYIKIVWDQQDCGCAIDG